MYRLTDYGSMLRDRRRVEAYRRALAAVITPTSVVLDLGCGIGTFSILAAQLGAARVYAVDAADIISVAEENARANGVAERIRFLPARATEIELHETVDVLVSDLGGALPLFEEHIPSVIHARDRFLAPGGAMIPRRDRLVCAPIADAALHARIVEPWHSVAGVDLRAAETMALHAPHASAITPQQLAAAPRAWAELDYATIDSPNVSGSASWTVAAATEIHGIALWFESDIGFASGPWSPESVHSTIVLPLLRSLRVNELHLELEATLASRRYVVTWQVNDEPRQSTFFSEPRSAASVEDRRGATASDAAWPMRVSERVLARRVGDELLLLDLDSGTYHVLNETGARVWELLSESCVTERIVDVLAREYDVDAGRAAADVAAVLASLTEAGLLK